jgi:hypothetical protein
MNLISDEEFKKLRWEKDNKMYSIESVTIDDDGLATFKVLEEIKRSECTPGFWNSLYWPKPVLMRHLYDAGRLDAVPLDYQLEFEEDTGFDLE